GQKGCLPGGAVAGALSSFSSTPADHLLVSPCQAPDGHARLKRLPRDLILATSGYMGTQLLYARKSLRKTPFRTLRGNARFHENWALTGHFSKSRCCRWSNRAGGGRDGRSRHDLRHQELRHDEEGARLAR